MFKVATVNLNSIEWWSEMLLWQNWWRVDPFGNTQLTFSIDNKCIVLRREWRSVDISLMFVRTVFFLVVLIKVGCNWLLVLLIFFRLDVPFISKKIVVSTVYNTASTSSNFRKHLKSWFIIDEATFFNQYRYVMKFMNQEEKPTITHLWNFIFIPTCFIGFQ